MPIEFAIQNALGASWLERNCATPASFPGAPVKPFHSVGDERIVVVRFYCRVTNLSEGQEVAPKSDAVKRTQDGPFSCPAISTSSSWPCHT